MKRTHAQLLYGLVVTTWLTLGLVACSQNSSNSTPAPGVVCGPGQYCASGVATLGGGITHYQAQMQVVNNEAFRRFVRERLGLPQFLGRPSTLLQVDVYGSLSTLPSPTLNTVMTVGEGWENVGVNIPSVAYPLNGSSGFVIQDQNPIATEQLISATPLGSATAPVDLQFEGAIIARGALVPLSY